MLDVPVGRKRGVVDSLYKEEYFHSVRVDLLFFTQGLVCEMEGQMNLEGYLSTHQEGEGNVVDCSSLHEEGETAVFPHTHTPQQLILPITGAHPLLSELTPEGLEDL